MKKKKKKKKEVEVEVEDNASSITISETAEGEEETYASKNKFLDAAKKRVSFSSKTEVIKTQKLSKEDLQEELNTLYEENKQLQELAKETEDLLTSKDQLNNDLNSHLEQMNEDLNKLQESYDLLTKTSQGLDKIILETTIKLQREIQEKDSFKVETETLTAELNSYRDMEKLSNKQLEALLTVELNKRGVLIEPHNTQNIEIAHIEVLKKENELLQYEIIKTKIQLDEQSKIKEQKQVEEHVKKW